MNLEGILSIAGKPGLFKMISQAKNTIVVESLIDKKRMPLYASHQVSALEDIGIYTYSDTVPLSDVFDAIAIKRNAIPLLGNNIQSTLMKKIVTSTVEKIYIALDNDALKKSLKFAEYFLNEGKEVHLVELEGKDPSEMGFAHFTNLIQQSSPLTQYTLMEKKLSLI